MQFRTGAKFAKQLDCNLREGATARSAFVPILPMTNRVADGVADSLARVLIGDIGAN